MSCIARITKLSVKISSKTWRLLGLCPNPPLISVHLEVSIKNCSCSNFVVFTLEYQAVQWQNHRIVVNVATEITKYDDIMMASCLPIISFHFNMPASLHVHQV